MATEMEHTSPTYKLSPSDFAYLYEECKLCYYLKVKEGIYQPSMPMPGVFGAINTRIQGSLVGKDLRTLSQGLPEGKVVMQEGWVDSKVVPGTHVYIKGKYDLLVYGREGHTLVDLKISTPEVGKIDKYKTQLNAYKYALENPGRGKPVEITRMGLLVFYPNKVSYKDGEASLTFPPKWLEVPQDVDGFVKFAGEIDKLLAGPPPPEGKSCKWCAYRHVGETLAHINDKPVQEDIPF
jgi:CRISPR/Cas system-associated exonuclease Cas4 (RecB family)